MAIPYVIALLSHSLIGDIFSGGIQLLWPFSSNWYYLLNFSVRSNFSVGLELVLFAMCSFVMFLNKDFQKIFLTTQRFSQNIHFMQE